MEKVSITKEAPVAETAGSGFIFTAFRAWLALLEPHHGTAKNY